MVFSVNQLLTICWSITDLTPGGEGVPLSYMYKLYRYVPPQRVWSLVPFRLENGHRLCSFWSGIGYGIQGNCGSV